MFARVEPGPSTVDDYRRFVVEIPAPVALVAVVGGEPRVQAISALLAEQFDAPPAVLEGRRLADLFRPRAAERICRAFANALRDKASTRIGVARARGERVVRAEVEIRPLGDAALVIMTEASRYATTPEEGAGGAALALAQAEQNERRRVGRELHDSTAQLLVAAQLGLGALQRRLKLTGDARRIVTDVRRSIAAAQSEIRTFSFMLHPPSLRDGGLAKTLEDFGAGFGLRTGLEVTVEVGDGPWDLPEAAEMALFRVAQEALMNVYRHARAQKAAIRLFRDGGFVVLEVEDDGVGMQRLRHGKAPAEPLGVGVGGMLARMRQLGGSLTLDSHGTGLRVRARAPVPVELAQPERRSQPEVGPRVTPDAGAERGRISL